ncbi:MULTISPECIES: hypothetical protein [unclassified Clostridium]|uniref:hypothetical protein n=1 Tax=unclassified Clostridium TaxID=2614128 RepID=UPI0002974BE0|nr:MULTISPECIES: hypothetical protein [unclassified Clostridium]EKQ52756.1 MAG: hypothetical protein A370_04061 [Clostridium sp. Maddingley MBC34-26]
MEFDIENIITGLGNFEAKVKEIIDIYGDIAAKELEEEVKDNLSYSSKTVELANEIESGKEWTGDNCIIYVAGNKQEFVNLELANDKRYAVLKPAIDKLSPEILRNMDNLLGG